MVLSRTDSAVSTPGVSLIQPDPSKGIKVNAGVIAKPFRDELKRKVDAMKAEGRGK